MKNAIADMVARQRWSWRLYAALSAGFWFMALVVGDGGTATARLSVEGAILNGICLIWLAKGSEVARVLLGFEAYAICLILVFDGLPPSGPVFNLLAFVSGAQLALLMFFWAPPLARSSDRPVALRKS
jgi:hypothetical protein